MHVGFKFSMCSESDEHGTMQNMTAGEMEESHGRAEPRDTQNMEEDPQSPSHFKKEIFLMIFIL